MLRLLPYPYVFVAVVALLPGAVAWWSGRRLARLADDPVLPERLIASQRHNGIACGIAFVLLMALDPRSLIWGAPLIFLGILTASYPLRKVLYGETWSLRAYLSFFLRLTGALFGFWMLLAATPSLARLAGDASLAVGAALGVVLLVWNARHAEVLRFCIGAKPMPPGSVLDNWRALAARCDIITPAFEVVALRGGVVANALAVPALRRPAVVFTETLLGRLAPEEINAICAHELAHLEYYNPPRLRRMNAVTIALIATASLWAPVTRWLGLSSPWLVLVWLTILTAALIARAHDKQRQETVCDLRAVALTGTPEALIAALTKLYTIARIPRRIEPDRERSDSHPSLARRIRDIRKAASVAPAALGAAAAFPAAHDQGTVTFEESVLRWVDAGAVTHAVEYAHLGELRIDTSRRGPARLVIRGGASGTWEVPLAASHLSAVQAVLDVVDTRLGEALPPRRASLTFVRMMIAVAATMALGLGQLALALVALLACIRPIVPLLVAAGLAALAAAGVTLRDGPAGAPAGLALPALVIAAVMFASAWSKRGEPAGKAWPLNAIVGTAALVATTMIALNGPGLIRLHQAARGTPSALILLIALAGALTWPGSRRTRVAAAGVIALASAIAAIGSTAFLDRFGRDPFLLRSQPFMWASLDGRALDEFDVPETTSSIRLSPDGRSVAALEQSEDAGTPAYHVGRIGEALKPIAADDLVFLDGDDVMLLEADEAGTTLRTVKVDAVQATVWSQRVDDLVGPSLSVDRASRRWQVVGWNRERGIVRAEGSVGGGAVERRAWPAVHTRDAYIDAVATAGDGAIIVESTFGRRPFDRLIASAAWMVLLQPFSFESRYWMLGPGGRRELGTSVLGADCTSGGITELGLVCAVFDGTRTRILTIDAVEGTVAAAGILDGRFAGAQRTTDGWLTGWVNATPVAIQLATRQVVHARSNAGAISQLEVSGGRVAALTFAPGAVRVKTFSLDPQITARTRP